MKKINWIFYGVIALFGLLVLIFPLFWIKLVVFALGLASLAYGVYTLLYTKKIYSDSNFILALTIKGIFSCVIGGLAVILPLAFAASIWRAMLFIMIFHLIIAAAIGFYSVSLLKNSEINRKPYIFENLGLLAVAALLLILSPEKLGTFIIRLLGLAVFVFGGLMLSLQFLVKKSSVEIEASSVHIKDVEEKKSEDNTDNE